ncbi:MAG: hypothetical protein KDI68_13245 [Gammaproteobacteria bacterium]|nr:hypothetical protein [Gammaproteobacteria bacterium]
MEITAQRHTPEPPVRGEQGCDREKVLYYLMEAGAQAPSFYNAQPWRFRSDTDSIELWLDPAADSSLYDWHNALSILSCGGVLENIQLAADELGLKTDVEIAPAPGHSALLARVTADFDAPETSTSPSDQDLAAAIWRRHTNTLQFDSVPLEERQRLALTDAIVNSPAVTLHLLEGPQQKERIFAAVAQAEQVRFAREDLHRHLHRMIRWTEAEASSNRTGLTLPAMGACGFGETFFRMTRSWPVMKTMNLFGAYRDQAKRANEGLKNCSAVGLLTIRQGDDRALLEAGRAMERLWLTATATGLDLQPHTVITIFHWIRRFGGRAQFDDWENGILDRAFTGYAEAFPALDPAADEQGVFLFRVGHGPEVRGYTLRRSPEELLLPRDGA